MNNTLVTQTSYLCSAMIVDHREEYYKCALDIIYMAGTFLGGEVFGIVGWRVLGSEIQWSKLCQDS